jgi:hypothetical protein
VILSGNTEGTGFDRDHHSCWLIVQPGTEPIHHIARSSIPDDVTHHLSTVRPATPDHRPDKTTNRV